MAQAPLIRPDLWEGASVSIRHADLYPCKPAWKIDSSVMEYGGLFFIVKGVGWVEANGHRLDARPGDLFFTRAGLRFGAGHDPERPVTVLSAGLVLRVHGGIDPLRRLSLPYRLRIPSGRRADFTRVFMELVTALHDETPQGLLAARGQALVLQAEALRLLETLPPACREGSLDALPGEETRMAAVLEHIDHHLAKPLELSALARVAHLTPVYFAALFRKETGRSPMAYVQERRIELARTLLAAGDYSVEEVARAAGFEDPFHFSRVFRKRVGLPPRAYRASLKNPFQP